MIEILILLYIVSVLATLALMYDDLDFEIDQLYWRETQILLFFATIPIANLFLMRVVFENMRDKHE